MPSSGIQLAARTQEERVATSPNTCFCNVPTDLRVAGPSQQLNAGPHAVLATDAADFETVPAMSSPHGLIISSGEAAKVSPTMCRTVHLDLF